ncbi:PucR family transcriptional regulator [Patulibacter defluvii]|uniref:PucR family transcriptional regulator n=1 Tax=Patulibacter defluvii TaxID=3095358 RepID=UPI002A74DB36|nr:PucR family transcriptional regulator ligand-binding domain-containing protein [Patulibacter sp. DM4]
MSVGEVSRPPFRSVFTLGDLIDEREFGLELVVGDEEALRRPVAGAQSMELDHPTRWLDVKWVMLTTGVRLPGRPDAQRELVRELAEANATALGFATDAVFHSIPEVILEEARELDFPVFSVPFETPYRDIISFVNRCLLNSEVQSYRRLTSMQRYLMDALADPQPEHTVIERLADLVNATVLLFSADGGLEAASGDAPTEELWAKIADRRPALREFDAAGWHAIATPVASTSDMPVRWLVVASRRAAFVDKLTKPVAQAAVPLLVAMTRLGDVARDQETAVRSSLLEEILAAPPGAMPSLLASRARAFGLDFARPGRMVVIEGASDGAASPERLQQVAEELWKAARDRGFAYLVAVSERAVTALLQELPEVGVVEVVTAFTEAREGIVAGIGRAVQELDAVSHSHRDTRIALERIRHGTAERVLAFERFDLATLLISQVPAESVQPRVEELLGPLRRNPTRYDALVAYFRHDLDIAEAAQSLHLHPNSLRYRLMRVEEELGESLKHPSLLATLYLALLASPDAPLEQ